MALTPLDFPASPTNGQTYPNPPVTGQPTYQWDAATGVWLSKFALGEEYVQLDGGQPMTGLLTLSGNPTAPMHAATKSYVDSTEKGRKNYIINGAMQVSQENGSTTGTVNGYYPVDMFLVAFSHGGTILTAQATNSPSPAGSPNRLRVVSNTADTSVAAGDYLMVQTVVEGLRAADLRFGSASARTVTIQFGIKAPAGTYCVACSNSATNRCFISEYVIAAGEANTDVVKSVTFAGDVTGTWLADNGTGLLLRWCLMAGATFQQAAGSWGTTNAMGSSNQFNFMGTAANTFELFDVSLTEGSVAPPFQVPDYASELALCKRYWEKRFATIYQYTTAGNTVMTVVPYEVEKRALPTTLFTTYTSITNATALAFYDGGTKSTSFGINATATGVATIRDVILTISARL
jgi:hypothetical protein